MKRVISTDKAPAAVGPYSQANAVQGLVFVSGQLPLIPGTKDLVDGDIAAATRRVLDNCRAVLEAAGSSLDRVVKVTVLMRDMAEFAAMNEVYGEYFPQDPPARAAFQVAALPLGAQVEMEMIAEE